MRLLITALLISTSAFTSVGAWADNIAGCEVVLMEKIAQDGLEGSAEVASFRPAEDFIASIYDDETETLREIDGLSIRAIMCKRQSIIPSLRDFPIVATGTPFMISQNFDSAETGLTTVYFQDGKFRSSYKGPELDAKKDAELADRMEIFNLQPHDLAEKEKAMLSKKEALTDEASDAAEDLVEDNSTEVLKETSKLESVASEDELIGATKASSTEESDMADDSETESNEDEDNPAAPKQKDITKEQHDTYK